MRLISNAERLGVFVMQVVDYTVSPEKRLVPGVCAPFVLVEGPDEPPLRGIMSTIAMSKVCMLVMQARQRRSCLAVVLQSLTDDNSAFLGTLSCDQPAG